MTREERLASGWKECWGCYDPNDDTWYGDSGWKKKELRGSFSREEAHLLCAKSFAGPICARRFWRGKKLANASAQRAEMAEAFVRDMRRGIKEAILALESSLIRADGGIECASK